MSATPVVEGWFTTGAEPRLLASRCTTCRNVVFPPVAGDAASFCRNPACAGEQHEPVELPEGLVVLGQVADGYGVADLRVGAEVELVVETLNVDETGERTIYRWKPVAA